MTIIGLAHLLVGVALLIDGSDGLRWAGAATEHATHIPWWAWGWWAVVGGALICTRRGLVLGLGVTAIWYALWAAAVAIGVLTDGGPLYAVPIYGLLGALHILVAVVELDQRRTP